MNSWTNIIFVFRLTPRRRREPRRKPPLRRPKRPNRKSRRNRIRSSLPKPPRRRTRNRRPRRPRIGSSRMDSFRLEHLLPFGGIWDPLDLNNNIFSFSSIFLSKSINVHFLTLQLAIRTEIKFIRKVCIDLVFHFVRLSYYLKECLSVCSRMNFWVNYLLRTLCLSFMHFILSQFVISSSILNVFPDIEVASKAKWFFLSF